jgi:hypothetical protein
MGGEYRVVSGSDAPPAAVGYRARTMTVPRPDQEFAVAPRDVRGGRSRGPRRFVGPVVALVALGLVGLGLLGPRLNERPHLDQAYFTTPAPPPTATPPPASVIEVPGIPVEPSPLPELTRNDGGRLTGSVGVLGDDFEVFDLGTGQSGAVTGAAAGTDLIRRTADGGYICVCEQDGSDGDHATRTVRVVRLTAAGAEISRRTIGVLGADLGPTDARAIQTDLDLAADGRRGLLVIGFVEPAEVSYAAMPIDLATGEAGALVHIAAQRIPRTPDASGGPGATDAPAAEDTPGLYGPFVRLSPSGGRAFVWSVLEQPTLSGPPRNSPVGWSIALDAAGAPTTVEPAPGFVDMPIYCSTLGFIRDERFVGVCPEFPAEGVTAPLHWIFVDIDGEGALVGQSLLAALDSNGPDVVFDRGNEVAWIWDSTRLSLGRLDTRTGQLSTVTYPPDVEIAPGITPPAAAAAPIWSRPLSALYGPLAQQIVGSADGSRLYLVATAARPVGSGEQPPSLGIFVVDPRTLALVGRWDPDAAYGSVQLAFGGSVVVAAGVPGVDQNGQAAAWDASLTFHDASDGQILLRLGRVGRVFWPMLIDP